ncbi:hypothetical protein AOLI_G00200420 [Acnodon oligacanthus]
MYLFLFLCLTEKQSTLEKVMTDEKSSPGILTKRKGRPNPKSVDASDVDEEASVPEKRQASGVEFEKELLENIKLRCGPVLPASPTLAGPLLPASPSAPPSAAPSPASPSAPPSAAPSPASPSGPPLADSLPPASPSSPPLTALPSPASASLPTLSAPPSPASTSAPTSGAPSSRDSTSPAPPLSNMIQQLKAENEALKRDLDALQTSVVNRKRSVLRIICKF